MKRLLPACLLLLLSCVKPGGIVKENEPKVPPADTTSTPPPDTTIVNPPDTSITPPPDTSVTPPPPPPPPPDKPTTVKNNRPDHIFVVFEENKGYSQIIGSSNAPFINSLVKRGTLFTNSHGNTHPSYPNYIAWFSGSTQGVNNDDCISGAPLNEKNLYTLLKAVGRSFVWYSEDLPKAGSETCSSGAYREKHNPTTIFSNVPGSANQPLSAMNLTDTSTFKNLPNVVAITPNMINDMHDGTVRQGDDWLKAKFAKLIDWCMRNNSVFIVTYDEDNKKEGNRIPTIAVGQNVKVDNKNDANYDHYSFLRTILAYNKADTLFHANVKSAKTIQNLWK